MTGDQSAATQDADTLTGTSPSLLKQYLADRDMPCPRCGYNLRMLAGDRCTECGTIVTLGVHAVEPVLVAWTAAVVIAGLGSGIALLFIVLILGKAGMPPSRYWPTIYGSFCALPALAALVFARRRFTRAASRVQWMMVVLLAAGLASICYGLASIR